MKTKNVFLLAIIPFLFIYVYSCKNQSENSGDSFENTFQELKEFIETPDSMLAHDEILKRDKLFNLIAEKIKVEDNQFYSTVSPKDFTDNGLSKYYYDILKKSIEETNLWVKEEGICNLDSMFQSSMSLFFKKELVFIKIRAGSHSLRSSDFKGVTAYLKR